MTSRTSTGSSAVKGLTHDIKDHWRHGERPDAVAALAEHPELKENKSAAIDLAFEEYWLRRQNGETIDIEEFCARFPHCRSSLYVALLSAEEVASRASVVALTEAGPLPSLAEGERFGDFMILRELGSGGLARVYLATEATAGDRPVAVKVSQNSSNEARTLGRLDHRHIVPILWADRDEASGLHVVCMPFLGSATLLDVMDLAYPWRNGPPPRWGAVIGEAIGKAVRPGDPLPDRRLSGPDLSRLSYVDGILRLGEQIADALAFLHQRKLVHCDLKPSNILLTPSGRVLLLDFNLSLADNVPAALIGGTFQYTAPEQLVAWINGKSISIEEGGQADLYSFGMILYELLTGHHPLADAPHDPRGVELAHWALQRQKEGFPPLRQRNPAVPPRIAKLLESCLALDPNARPAGVETLAAALRRHRRSLLQPILATAGPLLLLLGAALATAAAMKPPPIPPAVHRATGEDRLTRAWHLLQSGRSDEVEELLDEADDRYEHAIGAHIRQAGVKHGEWQDYAARARANMLLGDFGEGYQSSFTAAQSLFIEAERIIHDLPPDQQPPAARVAALWACLSYCYGRQKQYGPAVHYGEKALKGGFRSAALLNNVGYGCMMRMEFDKADRYLSGARQSDPNLLPALRNETVLALERCLQKVQSGQKVPVPRWVRDQLDEAIPRRMKQGFLESARPYVKAATLSAHLGDGIHALAYLSRACALGADPAQFDKDPVFHQDQSLARQLDAAVAAKRRTSAAESSPEHGLCDPLGAALP